MKIVTTVEGGMALTNDATLAERMGLLRSHGVTSDPRLMTHDPDGPDDYVARRHALARRYDRMLEGLPVVTDRLRMVAAE